MKRAVIFLTVVMTVVLFCGCTRIVKLDPSSGPSGTPVWVECTGLWGNPSEFCILWDGKTLCNPFPGSFCVPEDAAPGKHRVTLIDQIDASEIALVFPLIRLRHDTATFQVEGH